ncbi:MAG: TlpA disulfide reductase family protein [Sphingobium sp.]
MTLLLLAGLGACDRQSVGPEQPDAQGETSGEATAPAPSGSQEQAGFDHKIDRSMAGSPAPDFAFLDPKGGEATLGDVTGRPMLVNLWATWCAPCVAEMPALNRIAATYAPKGLAVFTISQDTQGAKAIAPFFAKHDLPNLKGWADPENQFGFHYGTGVLPTTVLYDAQGKEILRVVGAMDWTGEEARKLLDAAIAS